MGWKIVMYIGKAGNGQQGVVGSRQLLEEGKKKNAILGKYKFYIKESASADSLR